MIKTKSIAYVLLAASVTILLLATKPLPAQAQPELTVFFGQPDYVFDPGNGTTGTLFNVTVWVNSTESFNLMMWQVYIYYNSSLINITRGPTYLRAWPSDSMGGKNWDADYVFYGVSGGAIGNAIYYEPNMAGWSAIMLGDLIMAEENITTYPKKLCTLEFNITRVNGPLTSGLMINNEGTFLYDMSGQLPATITDGSYTYVPEPILAILLIVMTASVGVTALVKVKTRRKNE